VTTTPTASSMATTSMPPSATVEPAPVCLQEEIPFAADGIVATLGEGKGDAAAVGGVRWASHGTCERVIVDLLTESGAPAGALGEATVAYAADIGIVRVELPFSVTAVADSVVEGDMVERVFVVRRLSGELAIDIHLAADNPTVVRSFEVGEPARIILDLTTAPDGVIPPTSPTIAADVVVLSPLPGPAAYPLIVSGYARTFEANVVARLVRGGTTEAEATATAADWLAAWGEFELTFEEGPSGSVALLVGENSPADGAFAGASISLELG